MKKNTLFLLALLLPSVLVSQNLVPNPSFEVHKTCEFIDGAIDSNFNNPPVVSHWCSGNYSGTPDYFNKCQIYHDYYHLGVPVNNNGYQMPVTGNAYAGIVNQLHFTPSVDFRDYIQTKLLQKLEKGKSYCVGFYTAFAENDTILKKDMWSVSAIKNWGLLLSASRPFNPTNVSSTSPPTTFTLSGNPQIKATEFIKDTANWTLVSGIYTASGNEAWVTIGNFNPPGQTPIDTFRVGTSPNNVSYYYIDDVFVIPMNDGALLPGDTAVCMAAFPITVSAFSGFSNYQWSHGDTSKQTNISQPGIYLLHANYEGCPITDTIQVKAISPPELHLPDLHYCENQLPQLYTVPNSADFSAFQWSDGSSGPKIALKTAGNLVLSASGKCGAVRDTLHVLVDSIPIIDLGKDRSLCENGSNIVLELSNQVGILPNYQWSNGETTAKIQVNTADLYTVTTQNGCGTFTDEIRLSGCPPQVYVPNAFMPFGAANAENSRFTPSAANASIIRMDIYDRWGEHIFSQNSEAPAWDGWWRGRMCPEGIYAYIIQYKNLNNGVIDTLKGNFLLIK